jgi:D-glycero-alpha-D-manno-heptose 1-phosphate guanylyltransferase
MEIIILAGGFGTRLSHIISDVPKPMAPIRGTPFLVFVLEYISQFRFNKIIMATGHKSKIIEEYFGNNYKGIDIVYSVEKEPLGTGGAIKKALSYCVGENVCVINGDTYFDVDLNIMRDFHKKENAKLTIGLKEMLNFDRYGTVEIENDDVVRFNEKKPLKEGYINGGVYFIKRDGLNDVKERVFSFEKDYMEKFVSRGEFKGFLSDGYFIDIGIPEDYYKANRELKIN